ncbi:hypothetical protein K1719_007502 [Acacia pycnantha]|nr:hypothetical protein K1719_007502 [Acacia pycnantha]
MDNLGIEILQRSCVLAKEYVVLSCLFLCITASATCCCRPQCPLDGCTYRSSLNPQYSGFNRVVELF